MPTPESRWERLHALLVDLIALTYHEARNVRYLIKKHEVDAPGYVRLRDLPTNKFKAWAVLSPLRDRARASLEVGSAGSVFEDHFLVTLDDLIVLYKHEAWRDSQTGGNAWDQISRSVKDLGTTMQSGDLDAAEMLADGILQMGHNTGIVGEKLELLEKSLEGDPAAE